MMKRLSVFLLIGLLAALSAGCAAGGPTGSVTAQSAGQRTVTVIGTGEVSLMPDIAYVSLGVESTAANVDEAKSEVDSRMASLLEALQASGIEEKDVQTVSYDIYVERSPREGIMEAAGGELYHVSNMVHVKVRDINRIGAVIDAAVEAGANQVYGISFSVEDESRWQAEARARAMEDARSRAEHLAQLADAELGDVISVSEVIGGSPVGVRMDYAESALGGANIQLGELTLSLQIQVVFALR